MSELLLLAINLTQRCNLECAHCYLDAKVLRDGAHHELTREEVCGVLDEVAQLNCGTMVVLTGGEPLMRSDLEEIIRHGADRGLAMVVGTNGVALTERRARALQRAGALGVGISVDSLDSSYHESFRGVPGSWAKTMTGIENCRRIGLSFQIHFSIHEQNAHELSSIIDFARSSGARALNVFFLICTGRGESVSDISPQRYEQVLHELIEAQKRISDLIIRPRCAPHFKRVAFELEPDSLLNRISGNEGDGCIAGTHYCRITPEGGVTACPYIPQQVDNIRHRTFTQIWSDAPDFQKLRAPLLNGKCGACEYQRLCGGCRARPVAIGGALLDADPWCVYEPRGGSVIVPLSESGLQSIRWSPAAEQRLARVPAFLRRMVKRRAEAYVAELGEDQVTPQHLAVLAARRFGGSRPMRGGDGERR